MEQDSSSYSYSSSSSALRKISLLARLYVFTSWCMPIFAMYGIMLTDKGGLSTSAVSALLALMMITTMASELPTGALGDRVSRRTLLIGSCLLQAAAFSAWMIAPGFVGYALGFIMIGVGIAMSSGAFQAYLYDELRTVGASSSFTKIYGRAQSMTFFGMFVAYGATSLIGPTNYQWLLGTSISMSLVGAFVAWLLPKERIRHHDESTSSLDAFVNGVREVRSSKLLICFVTSIGLVSGCVIGIADYVPIMMKTVQLSVDHIPIALQCGLVASTVLAWNAHRFENWSRPTFCVLVITSGVCLLSASYLATVPAVVTLILWGRVVRVANLLFETSLQHSVKGSSRATIGSVPAFLAEMVAVVYMAAYGLSAYLADDIVAIRILAAMTIGSGVFLHFLWRKF